MHTRAVPANALSTPSGPNGQASHSTACPPTSNGIRGALMSASRNRLVTSQVATAIATDTTPIHTSGTYTSIRISETPRPTPTAIAAGRFLPAFDPVAGGTSD